MPPGQGETPETFPSHRGTAAHDPWRTTASPPATPEWLHDCPTSSPPAVPPRPAGPRGSTGGGHHPPAAAGGRAAGAHRRVWHPGGPPPPVRRRPAGQPAGTGGALPRCAPGAAAGGRHLPRPAAGGRRPRARPRHRQSGRPVVGCEREGGGALPIGAQPAGRPHRLDHHAGGGLRQPVLRRDGGGAAAAPHGRPAGEPDLHAAAAGGGGAGQLRHHAGAAARDLRAGVRPRGGVHAAGVPGRGGEPLLVLRRGVPHWRVALVRPGLGGAARLLPRLEQRVAGVGRRMARARPPLHPGHQRLRLAALPRRVREHARQPPGHQLPQRRPVARAAPRQLVCPAIRRTRGRLGPRLGPRP